MLTILRSSFKSNSLLFLIIGLFLITMLFGMKGTKESVTSIKDVIYAHDHSPNGFIGTPFEFSRARTQFIQVLTLFNRGTFEFSQEEAFATRPDAGYLNGTFRSLAPPGLSIIMYPFFLLGNLFGQGQIISYLPIIFFLLLSSLFFFRILKDLFKSEHLAATGTLIYTFGTPAIIYSSTPLYHTFSLFAIMILTWWTWKIYQDPAKHTKLFYTTNLLIGLSVFVDYAHPIILLPFYLYQIILFRRADIEKDIGFSRTFLISLLIPLLSISALFTMQYKFFGNMYQMTNTQIQFSSERLFSLPERTIELDTQHKNKLNEFVEMRYIQNHIPRMFLSPRRGFLVVSPIFIIAFLGLPFFFKRKKILFGAALPLGMTTIFTTILYAAFVGGPGDYTIGLRYLIPIIPFLILSLVMLISRVHWNLLTYIVAAPILLFSFVSHLSAFFTTIFSNHQKYHFEYGIMQLGPLLDELTSSYWYRYVYSDVPLFFYPLVLGIIFTFLCILFINRFTREYDEKTNN